MRFFLIMFLITCFPFFKCLADVQAQRDAEEAEALKRIAEIVKFYEMPSDQDLLEITEKVLQSPHVEEAQKRDILQTQRRIFVFTYPSDDLKIKGVISFVPHPEEQPMLLFLRGGNKKFGTPNPGSETMCARQYTVIASTYRDGINEGTDEFGGKDLNDVKNLVDFIPTLQQKLAIQLNDEDMYLIGFSRGAMQMFLSLARFPELQSRFAKIVALTGLLDMRETINSRDDMKKMYIEEFGLIEGVNEEEWINSRDPILAADKISRELPILIIQGTADIRVTLQEGYNMVAKLEESGHDVTYWEVPEGEHGIRNIKGFSQRIFDWLEQ